MRQVSPRGREQVLHAEGVGATLGKAPLFDGEGYIASAVAVAPTRLLLVPRDAVLDLCRRQPDVALAMLEAMGIATGVDVPRLITVARGLERTLDAPLPGRIHTLAPPEIGSVSA